MEAILFRVLSSANGVELRIDGDLANAIVSDVENHCIVNFNDSLDLYISKPNHPELQEKLKVILDQIFSSLLGKQWGVVLVICLLIIGF